MSKIRKITILMLLAAVLAACLALFFVSCNEPAGEDGGNTPPETTPEEGETDSREDPSKEAFVAALSQALGYGAEARLTLTAGDMRIEGTVRADVSENLLARIDLHTGDAAVNVGVQIGGGESLVLLEAFGEKLYFDLGDLEEIAYRVSALADASLPPVADGNYPPVVVGGTDVGAVLSALDELNAFTLLSLISDADITGVPAAAGGYEYAFSLGGVGAAEIRIDGENKLQSVSLRLSVNDTQIAATLDEIAVPEEKLLPADVAAEGYKDVGTYLSFIESVYAEVRDMRFEASGTLRVNGTEIGIENARVYSSGDGKDIAADFNAGKISVGGTLNVGGAHRVDAAFDGEDLYLSYNGKMNVKMNKSALDETARVLKDNFAFIADGFMHVDIPSGLQGLSSLLGMVKSVGLSVGENGGYVLSGQFVVNGSAVNAEVSQSAEGVKLVFGGSAITVKKSENASPVVAPENAAAYIDVSDVSHLADAFFQTANKNAFKLSGAINVHLNVLGIKADLSVGLEANVRINKNAEGRITGVDAYVVFDNTNVAKKGSASVEKTAVSMIHDIAVKYGKCIITYTGDTLYIDRMNMKKSYIPLKFGYQFEDTAYEHKSLAAADCTGDTLKNLIFYALGVNTKLVDLFKFDGTPDIASALGGYSSGNVVDGIPQEHDVTLNLAALTGSDMFKPSTVKISANADNLLVGLNIEELLIDFGAGSVKLGLSAVNDVGGAMDESCFDAYLSNSYEPF